jgi:hypothetical protein
MGILDDLKPKQNQQEILTRWIDSQPDAQEWWTAIKDAQYTTASIARLLRSRGCEIGNHKQMSNLVHRIREKLS